MISRNIRQYPSRKRGGICAIGVEPGQLDFFWKIFSTDPEAVFSTGTEVFSGRWGDVTDTVKVEIDGRSYLLKRYNFQGVRYALKSLIRVSRCFRAFDWGQRLNIEGVATPLPLFACEVRRFGVLCRSYILFPYINDAKNLLELWPDLDSSQRKLMMTNLGGMIGQLHTLGIHHDDLNWRNILVVEASDKFDCSLVDLDGCYMRIPTKRSLEHDLRHFIRDFERTETDMDIRNIFLHRWQQATGIFSDND